MNDILADFLDLRLRLCGRPDAVAIVDRCIRLIAEAEEASAETVVVLQAEVDRLRKDLIARFGPNVPQRVH